MAFKKLRLKFMGQTLLPTAYGDFVAYAYESIDDGVHHLALVKGDVEKFSKVLVRVHSECLTGDVFGSKRCDCGDQLHLSLKQINEEGAGLLIYLRGQEGRGIGLSHKIQAYSLQDQGLDTVEANLSLGLPIDSREYDIAAEILADLGVACIRLLTNNPLKYRGLESLGVVIAERVPIVSKPTKENRSYLKTKQEKLGHLLEGATCD